MQPNNQNPMQDQPMQGQPMPPQPMMGQPMPGQPYPPMQGQPMPGQPMYPPMPMQKPPKQPMDPAKKKKIIIICSIVSALVIVGIALAIILPIVLRVDYGESYRKVKELSTEINEIYNDYDCEDVEYYVSSGYVSDKTYSGYVESCRNAGADAAKLVGELGATSGVSRNADIKAQFDSFKKVYDTVVGNADVKNEALNLYSLWHKWAVAVEDLDGWDETDADLTSAANVLINSGNDQLKAYGEGWLERRKAAASAYRAYWAASYSDSNKTALRNAMNDAQNTYNNYVKENKPSTSDFPSVSSDEVSKLKSEFDKLYELISDTYEKNYNKDSGDCWEFVGEVICD